MDLGLKNKTVLITGGSSGIGKAVALQYAGEREVNIVISYNTGKEKAEQLVKSIEEKGNAALAVKIDFEDFATIETAIGEIEQKYGSIHVLVNNAVKWAKPEDRGIPFEKLSMEAWQEIFVNNFLGLVKVTQLVVPMMRKEVFGRIVNVSSDIAFDSMFGSGAYGSLKSALFGLTANLVTELSQYNILTNDVAPSWTLTDNAKQFFDKNFQKQAIKAFPTQKITTPEEIAGLIAYLGSACNGHVNGERIKVTGKGSQPMLNHIFQNLLTQ